jgi:hypothetical protein
MERGEPASGGESLYRLPFLVILPTKSRIAFFETQLLLRARNHRQSWSEFVIAELKIFSYEKIDRSLHWRRSLWLPLQPARYTAIASRRE